MEKERNDEWYTREYAVKPILEFLKPNSKIWCPFDMDDSEFVKVLKKEGHTVINTHIWKSQDFFEIVKTDLSNWNLDYIISNPPYSKRKQVIEALIDLNTPFAMLLPLVSIVLKSFRLNLDVLEMLGFKKRIKYNAQNGMLNKNAPSETGYICMNMLPRAMMTKEIGDVNDVY